MALPDGETTLEIARVTELDLDYAPQAWPFATERRDDIALHFEERRRRTPALWNGRVLLMSEAHIAEGKMRGRFFDTEFASFIAWRDWGWPDRSVTNSFAMGALRGGDGGYLLAVMGDHTANAGLAYFPCGTPDPTDIAGTKVDLARSLRRELTEETGLRPPDYRETPGWHTVRDGARLALIKILDLPEPAEAIRARIRDYLASEREPELADMRIVRSTADFYARVPGFVTAFLEHIWGAPPPG